MKTLVVLAASFCFVATVACSSSSDSNPAPVDDTGTLDSADATAETTCGKLLEGFTVDAGAKSDLVPGSTVTLAITSPKPGVTYTWTVPNGKLSSTTGASVTWTLDTKLAIPIAETISISVVASYEGCVDETLAKDVIANWPDPLRTIVIFNPKATGSDGVAKHYATFRKIPDDHLCSVSADDPTTLAGTGYDAFADAVFACVDKIGSHVQYLVPVWGVPYKVSGRVKDSIAGATTPTTISLDAMLALGKRSKSITASFVNPFYQKSNSITGAYKDYQPFGKLRAKYADNLYFMVARMDGADADAANKLVDRTSDADALAKAGKLAGTVYVDGNKGLPHPTDATGYNLGEWWIIGVENVFKKLGTYPIVADYNGEEFGTAPAPLTAPDALYYAGWYSFGNYNDAFTWKTGAIGGHLDSCSACDLRGSKDWSAMALRKGITATFGAVNEPYVSGMPAYDLFFHMLVSGASLGEAAYESTWFSAWMMVWAGDPLYRPYAKP